MNKGDRYRKVLFLCAVEEEARGFLEQATERITLGPKTFYLNHGKALTSVFGLTGVGKASAAMTAALAIKEFTPALVVNFGIGGGFTEAGAKTGELAIATEDIYADEGVITARGFSDLRAMGLSVLETEDNHGRFPTSPKYTEAIYKILKEKGLACHKGRFITVSTVTGTEERAAYLYRRFRPICESMEGAAVGHASRAFGVEFVELRAISNPVGRRQRHRWRIKEAVQGLTEAMKIIIDFLKN